MIDQLVDLDRHNITSVKERNKIHKEMPIFAGGGEMLSENYCYLRAKVWIFMEY